MNDQLLKGAAAEECLRKYFLNSGYFVVRGCKFQFMNFDATDVDLWLYSKVSLMNRERINVDIKNKKTPQAVERIFWVKGLQSVLGMDRCIVATSDTRSEVREFGLQHNVTVIGGGFLQKLIKKDEVDLKRINEEQFTELLDRESLGKLGGDWKGRYEKSKSRILTGLTFDSCNAWLEDIRYFLEVASTGGHGSFRVLYVIISYFLISVDFILRDYIVVQQEERRTLLDAGFRYGTAGKIFTDKVGRIISALTESVSNQSGLGRSVQLELDSQAQSIRADILAEFFSKAATYDMLFDAAREAERAAFFDELVLPSSLSAFTQSIIAVLVDFHGIDRKRVLI